MITIESCDDSGVLWSKLCNMLSPSSRQNLNFSAEQFLTHFTSKIDKIRATETEMLSLSVYESIAKEILHGGTVPQFGGRGQARGRVWHPAKVLCIRLKNLIGTEMLSLSVNEPIAKQILVGGPSSNLGGRGRVRGSNVVPRESPSHWA